MNDFRKQLKGHQYINLETYRKNGQGVRTPVWFVHDGDALWVWTQANSGKVKRIRRNGRVRLAPCTASGDLLSDWMEAYAVEENTPEAMRALEERFRARYGLLFRLLRCIGKVRGARYTGLRIRPL